MGGGLVLLALSSCAVVRLRDVRPVHPSTVELQPTPAIHLTRNLLSNASVARVLAGIPLDEAAWHPCIGQKQEYAYKKCALVAAPADVLSAVEASFPGVDTSALAKGGLPIIRYLKGSRAVGVHGDVDHGGRVPNATIVVYLTDAETASDGQTFFPALDLRVSPEAGAALTFANVDERGWPDARARHGVSAVSRTAARDRLVVQIPLRPNADGDGWEAYAEHVSGAKHAACAAAAPTPREAL